MKIALIHNQIGGPAGGGGGVRQMLELGRALDQLGHEIVVCCHSFDRETAFVDDDEPFEIRFVQRGMAPPASSFTDVQKQVWRSAPAIAKLVPDDVDVINAHEMPGHIAGWRASRRLKVPWVWTRNDPSFREFLLMPDEATVPLPTGLRRKVGMLASRTDVIAARSASAVCVLDTRNARMVERAYGRPATVVRSGPALKFFEQVDRGAARSSLGLDDSDFLVIAVGILMPYRRFEDLIEAVAQMRGDMPGGKRVRAVLVGSDKLSPGYAQELRALHARLELGEECELRFDSVPDQLLRDLYTAADAFVFPNEKQTWGLAPLEAIAGNTPVVVSRGAGVHEVLEGFPGVKLVDPRRPDQIAAALLEMASEPHADVSDAREWILSDLSGTAFAQHMAELMAGLSR